MLLSCEVAAPTSVTRKKSPNVYKSCPKMISLEKLKILTPLKIAQECTRFGQINCCPKSNTSPNLVTLFPTHLGQSLGFTCAGIFVLVLPSIFLHQFYAEKFLYRIRQKTVVSPSTQYLQFHDQNIIKIYGRYILFEIGFMIHHVKILPH